MTEEYVHAVVLSDLEVLVLISILGWIAGDPGTTYRGVTENVLMKLKKRVISGLPEHEKIVASGGIEMATMPDAPKIHLDNMRRRIEKAKNTNKDGVRSPRIANMLEDLLEDADKLEKLIADNQRD